MKISWTVFKLKSGHKITIIDFKELITKMYRQDLRFLYSARRLMMLYISMKFHENILNGFQVIEGTQNYHCRISKGNNSKNATAFVLFTSSAHALYFYEISLKCLWVIEQTRNYHCRISKGE